MVVQAVCRCVSRAVSGTELEVNKTCMEQYMYGSFARYITLVCYYQRYLVDSIVSLVIIKVPVPLNCDSNYKSGYISF